MADARSEQHQGDQRPHDQSKGLHGEDEPHQSPTILTIGVLAHEDG